MNSSMSDIPVNDILPLVEISDYSVYLFAGSVGAVAVVSVAAVFALLKYYRRRGESERQILYRQLKTLDLSDPKKAAYAISRIGYRFSKDNERTAKGYQNLFERLEPYKYAPRVDPIDEETLGYFRLYLEMIDV